MQQEYVLILQKQKEPSVAIPENRKAAGGLVLLRLSGHCCLCFMCSSFFVGIGNSYSIGFRLYCRYNKREGERQHGTDKELVCSDPPGPPQSGMRVNANQKMSIFAGMECHFSPVSMRWVCSLDYPLLAGLKPVKS